MVGGAEMPKVKSRPKGVPKGVAQPGLEQKEAVREFFRIAAQKRRFKNAKPLTEAEITTMVANHILTKGVTQVNAGTAAGTKVTGINFRVML